MLRFKQVEFTHVHDAGAATVICGYQARLHRADLGGSFRHVAVTRPRRRVSVPAEPRRAQNEAIVGRGRRSDLNFQVMIATL